MGLLKKFPRFSEKDDLSAYKKRERQRINVALQVAVVQLAQAISGEATTDKLIPQVQQEKEPATAASVSFDSHSTFA